MPSEGNRLSLCPKTNHPDSESGLQWFAETFVTGPALLSGPGGLCLAAVREGL
jgi:hypothetical protein